MDKDMRKIALLGMTAGLLIANQPALEAAEDNHWIDLNYAIAKPSCKAHGGCGGDLTASRDRNEDADSIADDDKDDDADLQKKKKKLNNKKTKLT